MGSWNPTLAASEFSALQLFAGGKDGAPGGLCIGGKDGAQRWVTSVDSRGYSIRSQTHLKPSHLGPRSCSSSLGAHRAVVRQKLT
jgi:hypothetical protein